MLTPEELTRLIEVERARQSLLDRPGIPDGVRVGPLISLVMDGAAWRGTNAYPSAQVWADESERLFNFAVSQNQFARFLPKLRGRWNQFESAQAELRVAFFFHRNGFRVTEWEPVGAAAGRGEFTIAGPSRVPIFTEVKSPGWKGELTPEELKVGRQHQPKGLFCDGRAVAPWRRVQSAASIAYRKFDLQKCNLLVLADDLFVGLKHGTEMQASYALYSRATGGCFTDRCYENLGGVAFFWLVPNTDPIAYDMDVFLNPHALRCARLPEDFRVAFHARAGAQKSPPRMRTLKP